VGEGVRKGYPLPILPRPYLPLPRTCSVLKPFSTHTVLYTDNRLRLLLSGNPYLLAAAFATPNFSTQTGLGPPCLPSVGRPCVGLLGGVVARCCCR